MGTHSVYIYIYLYLYLLIYRTKFGIETSDNMDRWKSTDRKKQSQEFNLDVEKARREKIRDGESQKKENAGAGKGRKVAKHSVIPMFCGSGGSKSRLAKSAAAEPAGQMRDEKLHTVVARSRF